MLQKAKVKVETKITLVIRYLAGEISQREGAEAAGVTKTSFQQWIAKYEAEGSEAFCRGGKNRKYSAGTKRQAVEAYLAGNKSQVKICKEFKIRSRHILQEWIKEYNVHGDFESKKKSGGGSRMKQGRDTTQAERIKIARECLSSGKDYGEAARKYKVSYQQVRSWTLKYEKLGETGLEDRRGKRKKDQMPRTELEAAQIEIEQLKHELYLAKMERDLLKKLDEIERRDASHK